MKYVMFARSVGENGLQHFVPVIFPNNLVHSDVANAMIAGSLEGYKVVSGGEYCPMSGGCSGGSETLNVDANEERDERIIRMNDYGGGFQ